MFDIADARQKYAEPNELALVSKIFSIIAALPLCNVAVTTGVALNVYGIFPKDTADAVSYILPQAVSQLIVIETLFQHTANPLANTT